MADTQTKGIASTDGVKVVVEPRVCMHDTPTSIKVVGLHPQASVTLSLTTHNDNKKRFHSYAHYVSDDSGAVDVERSKAVDGSYKGLFPAGLFSSLREFPNNYTRLQKDNPRIPWLMTLAVDSGHLSLEQSVTSDGLDKVLLERHIMGPGVRKEAVVHERVRGSLFFPAGPGPYPAVVDIFGGFGGLKEYRASMLASKGFACLAIAYFGYDDLPKALKTLDIEYFEEAVEYLLQQPGVIPDRCGVLCSSKGGNPGLAMGIYLPKVTAVVSIAGKFIDEMTLTFRGRNITKAYTMDLSYYEMDEENGVSWKESKLKTIYSKEDLSILPCELAPDDTYFLLVVGDDDGTCAHLDVQAVEDRISKNGRLDHWQIVKYAGTGHIIETPYNTHAPYSTYDQAGMKFTIKWGGNPIDFCKAQENNWQNMRKFFELHIRDRSAWFQQHLERQWRGKKL